MQHQLVVLCSLTADSVVYSKYCQDKMIHRGTVKPAVLPSFALGGSRSCEQDVDIFDLLSSGGEYFSKWVLIKISSRHRIRLLFI